MTKRSRSSRNTTTAIIYCRVSAAESQNDGSTLSLEQQESTLTALAAAAGYADIRVVRERHTASKTQPALEEALADLAAGTAAALFAAKIDRLSRKGARDVLRIADLADAQGWRLVVADMGMDTSTTVGRLVLTILAGIAEMESSRRSERMAEYHAARRNRGERSGRDYGRQAATDPAVVALVMEAHTAGQTRSAIARTLEDKTGKRWHPTQVRRIITRHTAA